MTLKLKVIFIITLSMLIAQSEANEYRYSQIVIPFPDNRAYDYHFNRQQNSVVIDIRNTRPDELEPLYNYDDRLIRRLIIKELSNKDTQIKMVLKDQLIQAAIYSFTEPDRIVIDLYDRRFKEQIDPNTGIPYVESRPSSNRAGDRIATGEPARKNYRMSGGSWIQPSTPPPPSPSRSANTSSQGKRKLLQPKPQNIQNSKQLILALEKASPGLGPRWKTYPEYIYRIQTNSLKRGKNYKTWLKRNANRAMSSGESMADYAAQLYTFGHELKALIAYQKVLHEYPLVFDKEARHIWNLAEIHFGQGNNTLADGYYQSLIDKHPDSPLANYANLRKLDIRAIKAMSSSDQKSYNDYSKKLSSINTKSLPELQAQIAIRKAYWDQSQKDLTDHFANRTLLPKLSPEARIQIENTNRIAENPKTSFLSSSILLKDMLMGDQWNSDIARFAGSYFSKFKGKGTEPHRTYLLNKTKSNISKSILASADTNKSLKAINTLESLPVSLEKNTLTRDLAWAIGESYRKIQQPEKAIPYYEQAYNLSQSKTQEFEAKMFFADVLKKSIDIESAKNNTAKIQKLRKKLKGNDANLKHIWNELEGKAKFEASVRFKGMLERNLDDAEKTKTHDLINLWSWTQSIQNPKSKNDNDTWAASYKTSSETIFMLSKLSKQFQQMGDQKNYRKAKSLLRNLDPESFKNPEAERLWAQELTELAEIHRENNDYLDAGRIYALTGDKSKNWDKRAEALYKGGLLLYRSGRREEALQAFEKAANDGNNLLYAELAKKRLEQLNE